MQCQRARGIVADAVGKWHSAECCALNIPSMLVHARRRRRVVSVLSILNWGVYGLKDLGHGLTRDSTGRMIIWVINLFGSSDNRTEHCFKTKLQQARKIKTPRDNRPVSDSTVLMVGWCRMLVLNGLWWGCVDSLARGIVPISKILGRGPCN